MRRALLLAATLLAASACQSGEPARERAGQAAAAAPVRFEAAEPGEVAAVVKAAIDRAAAEGRRVLVYVGASWCEPCTAFHAAAKRGELDAALPGVTFLEFDADRDDDRLAAAGYTSRMVPLFVRPQRDGTASGLRVEGARTGGDHARELTARLAPLLEAP